MELKKLSPETLEKASGMLKALAHPARISIIGCLEDGRKHTVTEIHKQLGIEQSTASHHLVILKDRGVLSCKREGKNIYYYLRYDKLKNMLAGLMECCGE
jgi:DNA-binding transcriptional ArsR family regulator